MIGNLISAGASLVGGMMGRDAAQEANQQNWRIAQKNFNMQKQFAQEGLRWKVQDAEAAGIHPVYALGAPTTSFSPVSFSATADNSMGSALASAGQDIGRAIDSTRTGGERVDAYTRAVQGLTLEKASLENQLLASQIKRLQVQSNPPMPSIASDPSQPFPVPESTKPDERPPLMMRGVRWQTNPNTTPMKGWTDQYGDEGPVASVLPILLGINDLDYNLAKKLPRGFGTPAEAGRTIGRWLLDRYNTYRGRR